MVVTSPIRERLWELTHELNETGVDPFEGYELLTRSLGKLGLRYDTYCSSSITSGGHARDESLEMGEIIQRNTDSAYDLADELYRVGQLDAKTSVEAVAVGKVRHWSQSDYMTFWLGVMSRVPVTGHATANRIDTLRDNFTAKLEQRQVNMALYNDNTASAAARVGEYMKHADVFVDVAIRHEASPIERLVRMIDTDQSLGAQTENYFARVMGTRVMRVAVAHVGDAKLPVDFPASRLVADTSKIVSFGGHVFDTEQRTQLTLVPESSSSNP